MQHRGDVLRRFRQMWGLSTRGVEAKSQHLAELWGDPAYVVHSSYLTKLETGERRVLLMSMAKMTSLTEILSKGSNTMLKLCRPPRYVSLVEDPLGGPEYTQIIREGRLAETFSTMLSSAFPTDTLPKQTQIVPISDSDGSGPAHPFQDRKRYVRAIVGQLDLCLFPLILPGSLLVVDRNNKTLAKDGEYDNELERPIFLIQTHDGYSCCWCDPMENGEMLKVIQHPLGILQDKSLVHPLKIGQQVEIVGEVAFYGMDRRSYSRRRHLHQ